MWSLALIAAFGATLTDEAVAPMRLEKAELTLADIADLSHLPPGLQARAAAMVLAKAPARGGEFTVSKGEALRRAAARMPVLTAHLPSTANGVVILRRAREPSSKPAVTCWRVEEPRAAGEIVSLNGLSRAACQPDAAPATRYDPDKGALRAARDLVAGALISTTLAGAPAATWPGREVRLTARVGPVRVERSARALQAAQSGEDFFVETEDGAVFSTAGLEVSP